MNIIKAVTKLIYPLSSACVLCSREIDDISRVCEDCLKALDSGKRDMLVEPPRFIDGIVVSRMYRGDAGKLVRAFKYSKIRALSRVISDRIFASVRISRFPVPDVIVYVPPHRSLARGGIFDHAGLLADEVAVNFGMRAKKTVKRVRNGKRQATLLTHEEREKNVTGAFKADKSVSGHIVLLIDDVYTTGSTANECAKALKLAGAKSVYVAAFARGASGIDGG